MSPLNLKGLALRITAGPGYDPSDHVQVPVNQPRAVRFSTDLADIELWVRIRDFKGLPSDSPPSCAYFETGQHASRRDQLSICMIFRPKRPTSQESGTNPATSQAPSDQTDDSRPSGISAADLQFGNDFDLPIRSCLPPGFNTALRIFRWTIDPGIDGDAYADRPYLYGTALSSFNTVRIGQAVDDPDKGGLWVDEGGDADGLEARHAMGVPLDPAQRARWALGPDRNAWVWKYDQDYALDFFNAYLDVANFSVRLPGFQLSVLKWWEGQPLRYVLRNRLTGYVYLSVVFTLHLPEHIGTDGNLVPGPLSWSRLASSKTTALWKRLKKPNGDNNGRDKKQPPDGKVGTT